LIKINTYQLINQIKIIKKLKDRDIATIYQESMVLTDLKLSTEMHSLVIMIGLKYLKTHRLMENLINTKFINKDIKKLETLPETKPCFSVHIIIISTIFWAILTQALFIHDK